MEGGKGDVIAEARQSWSSRKLDSVRQISLFCTMWIGYKSRKEHTFETRGRYVGGVDCK